MRPFLISLACLMATATISLAQDDAPPPPMHGHDHGHEHMSSEVTVGHGFMPSDQLFGYSSVNNYGSIHNVTYTGAFSVNYKYHISRVITLGITAAYERQQGSFSNFIYFLPPPNIRLMGNDGSYCRQAFTVAPELTVTYGSVGHGLVSIYGTVGAGYNYNTESVTYTDNHTERVGLQRPIHFNAYTSPLGVRFGRALSGYFELGLGYKGVVNYGLTYRF